MAALLLSPSALPLADPATVPGDVAGGCTVGDEPNRVLLLRLVRALARQAAAEAWARAGFSQPAPESEP